MDSIIFSVFLSGVTVIFFFYYDHIHDCLVCLEFHVFVVLKQKNFNMHKNMKTLFLIITQLCFLSFSFLGQTAHLYITYTVD